MTRMPHATGYKGIMESGKSAGGNMAITKDCKDPVLAFRLLDYIMFSDEAAKLLIIGLEGVTYNIVNGKIVMTDFVTKTPTGFHRSRRFSPSVHGSLYRAGRLRKYNISQTE